MAYVQELISPEDYIKYGLEEYKKKYYWCHFTKWIIDHEKGYYLQFLEYLRDDHGSIYFYFKYKESLFELSLRPERLSDVNHHKTYKWHMGWHPELDLDIKKYGYTYEEVYAEIKLALHQFTWAFPNKDQATFTHTFAF